MRSQLANVGGGRRVHSEPADEIVERRLGPERVDRDARGVVADAAGHAFLGGKAVDPRPEADALHDAANLDAPPDLVTVGPPSDST